jgi:hypothetical protein
MMYRLAEKKTVQDTLDNIVDWETRQALAEIDGRAGERVLRAAVTGIDA